MTVNRFHTGAIVLGKIRLSAGEVVIAMDPVRKVMADQSLPAQLEAPAQTATVQQIRVPEQDIPFLSQKKLFRESVSSDQPLDPRLVSRLVTIVAVTLEFVGVQPDLVRQDEREPMGAGVVDNRTGIGVNILEGNPSRHQISRWLGRHVNRITVRRLLRPFVRGNGLKGLGRTTEEKVGDAEDLGMMQESFYFGNAMMHVEITFRPWILRIDTLGKLFAVLPEKQLIGLPGGVQLPGRDQIADDNVAVRCVLPAQLFFPLADGARGQFDSDPLLRNRHGPARGRSPGREDCPRMQDQVRIRSAGPTISLLFEALFSMPIVNGLADPR